MDKYKLNSTLHFITKPYKGKLRFIIYDDKKELVCRIETRNNIEEFLKEKEARIFNGRLQLHKIDQQINVEFKRNAIGCVSVDHFRSMLQKTTV